MTKKLLLILFILFNIDNNCNTKELNANIANEKIINKNKSSLQEEFINNSTELMDYITWIVKKFTRKNNIEITNINEIINVNAIFKQIGNKSYLLRHHNKKTLNKIKDKNWNKIELIFNNNINKELKSKIIKYLCNKKNKKELNNNWQIVINKDKNGKLYNSCKFLYSINKQYINKLKNDDKEYNERDNIVALLQSKFIKSTNILREYFESSKFLLKIKKLSKDFNIKVNNIRDVIDLNNISEQIAKHIFFIKNYGTDNVQYLDGNIWSEILIKFKKNIPEKLQSKIKEFLIHLFKHPNELKRSNWKLITNKNNCKYVYTLNNELKELNINNDKLLRLFLFALELDMNNNLGYTEIGKSFADYLLNVYKKSQKDADYIVNNYLESIPEVMYGAMRDFLYNYYSSKKSDKYAREIAKKYFNYIIISHKRVPRDSN